MTQHETAGAGKTQQADGRARGASSRKTSVSSAAALGTWQGGPLRIFFAYNNVLDLLPQV